MEIKTICGAIEAILFASGEPMELSKIAQAVSVGEEEAEKLLYEIKDRCDAEESGVTLLKLENSYQFVTKPEYSEAVKTALESKRNTPLSNAAMEVLAVIAYHQPVTRGLIEQVRGVDSSQTVNNLIEKGLIEEAGRLDLPGRPIAYRTTAGFLRTFSLRSLNELPPLPDKDGQMALDDILKEQTTMPDENR